MDKYSFVKDSFVNKYSFVKDTLISFDSLVDKYSFVKETLVGFNSLILMLESSYTEPGCVLKLDSHKILHQLVRFDTIFSDPPVKFSVFLCETRPWRLERDGVSGCSLLEQHHTVLSKVLTYNR